MWQNHDMPEVSECSLQLVNWRIFLNLNLTKFMSVIFVDAMVSELFLKVLGCIIWL